MPHRVARRRRIEGERFLRRWQMAGKVLAFEKAGHAIVERQQRFDLPAEVVAAGAGAIEERCARLGWSARASTSRI